MRILGNNPRLLAGVVAMGVVSLGCHRGTEGGQSENRSGEDHPEARVYLDCLFHPVDDGEERLVKQFVIALRASGVEVTLEELSTMAGNDMVILSVSDKEKAYRLADETAFKGRVVLNEKKDAE